MKKKMLMASSLVAVSALSILGTKAYLADTDQDVNVMTTGNVKIEQHEYERKVDEKGNFISTGKEDEYKYTPDQLQEFTQGKPFYPAVYDKIMWDNRNGSTAEDGTGHQQSWAEVGAPGSDQLFDDSMKNVQDKFVFVENTGKSDAYYRTIIAVETPKGMDSSLIHTNISSNNRFDWKTISDVAIDGVNYTLYVATYNEVLKPGEVSRPSFLQAFLGKEATNEDVAKFGDTFEILVTSQAVQTVGFENADKALNAQFGDITKSNHPWKDTAYVKNNTELEEALENGSELIFLSEGNYTIPAISGRTITIVGSGENTVIDRSETVTLSNTDITIQNAKIIGSNKDYVGFYQAASETYIDCTFEGGYWLYGTKAEFIDCEFNQTSSDLYNVWTYGSSDVTFENCIFNSAGKSLLVYNEGGSQDPTYITVNNSKFNATTPVNDKAAIEIDSRFNEFVVTINNSKAEGFANGNVSGNSLWNNKLGNNTTVVVDGKSVLEK